MDRAIRAIGGKALGAGWGRRARGTPRRDSTSKKERHLRLGLRTAHSRPHRRSRAGALAPGALYRAVCQARVPGRPACGTETWALAAVGGGGRGVNAGGAAEGVGSDFPAPKETRSVTRRPALDRGRLRQPALRDPALPGAHSPALAPAPHPAAPGGGGTGSPRSARLRVWVSGGARLASCEAWMGSSCRLSPPRLSRPGPCGPFLAGPQPPHPSP